MFRAHPVLRLWQNAEFFRTRYELRKLALPVWSGLTQDCWKQYPLHFVVAVGSLQDLQEVLQNVDRFTGLCGKIPGQRRREAQESATVNDFHHRTLETALDFAIQKGSPEFVELLLKNGALPSPLSVQLTEKVTCPV